jgi:hypothetical protein
MSFEAVLGNKEFEFVVSEVTLTVVTRHSASRHGVSVLVSVTGRVHLIPLFNCHSDSDSCAPEVMVPDARVFSSIKNEQKYPWVYDSVVHQGYLCKFCEPFCCHSSSSQEFVTVGINLENLKLLFLK